MNVKVSVDFKEYERMMGDFKSQNPYVLSKAINDTMIEAQTNVVTAMTGRFTIRRPAFLKRSVKMIKFAKKGDLTAVLGIADMGGKSTSDIFGKFEDGGTKTPSRGHHIAVPSSFIRPVQSKIVTKGNRPRNLNRSFKLKAASGQELLMVRRGRKKNSRLEVAYIFKASVPIDNRLGFITTSVDTINRTFDGKVDLWWKRAMVTARTNG